eukprot:g1663.t1
MMLSKLNFSRKVFPRCHRYFSAKPLFKKILIANRGEIAVRVIETARRLGIKTVAIYSEPDADAKHVLMADEAVCVGPAASTESYLNIDKILEVIKDTGAEAVHPGYGFLSENAEFSDALAQAGIEFIGPNAHAILSMGDKIESMRIAESSGVSCAPRFDGECPTVERAIEIAGEIGEKLGNDGYPIIMKASAGGGGKGMRVAWNEEELIEGFRLAREEAASSFGDDRMLIQHFVCPTDGRHIEIQLIGDKHGNYAAFPERECSIQRRNQKVLEESPSVLLTPETRASMQAQAVALARAVGYHSAGTVEFLCDNDQNFYFLEMNTRLQVEHPVSEEVTGQDLVELMLRVSAGEKLPSELIFDESKDEPGVPFQGWSLEARVYAEDPVRGFLPSTGRLLQYEEPTSEGSGANVNANEKVRVDSGVLVGSEISMFYDPMVSKLVTYSPEGRLRAIDLMIDALDNYVISGIAHNGHFCRALCSHERFRSGALTTEFIGQEYADGFEVDGFKLEKNDEQTLLSVAALLHVRKESPLRMGEFPKEITLQCGTGSNLNEVMKSIACSFSPELDGGEFTFETGERVKLYDVDWKGAWSPVIRFKQEDSVAQGIAQYVESTAEGFKIQFCGGISDVVIRSIDEQNLASYMIPKVEKDMSKWLLSPMPGQLISVNVEVGQEVQPGQELAVVEAMKMQSPLKAEKKGKVKAIFLEAGATLAVDEEIIEFE